MSFSSLSLQRGSAFAILLLATASALGCSGGSEEIGRVKASKGELIGVYRLQLENGTERLELKDRGQYIQEDSLGGKSFRHEGKWQLTSHLFGGSEVLLLDAMYCDASGNVHEQGAEITLQVHTLGGKLALARNEVADWYYERVD